MEAPVSLLDDHPQGGARPYRSHLQPACNECRKRKSRCVTKPGFEICLHCQLRQTRCEFTTAARSNSDQSPRGKKVRGKKQQSSAKPATESSRADPVVSNGIEYITQLTSTESISDTTLGLRSRPQTAQDCFEATAGILDVAEDDSPHGIGPTLVDDRSQISGSVLTELQQDKNTVNLASVNRCSSQDTRPVMFTTVRRRPLGLVANQSLSAQKCQIIEMMIGPRLMELIDVFFEKTNACFPVFDEAAFRFNYNHAKEKISPAILCNLYAVALVYWQSCPTLSTRPCPDVMFIWLQASEALNSEAFQSPGLSSILAMILNVGGRPSKYIFGNGALLGVAIAQANALGLNRDPSDWNISNAERLARIRVWWLIVMQDRWSSLAYGTPLQINRRQFDVPVLRPQQLSSSEQPTQHVQTTSIFVSLITLTEVLGCILERLYDVAAQDSVLVETEGADFGKALEKWEDSQNDEIRRMALRGTRLNTPGAANLRLAYLGIKFLWRRNCLSSLTPTLRLSPEASLSLRSEVRRLAEEIVHFVQELDEHQLRGFWFPMHAYTLTSVTSFLIRDALKDVNVNQGVSRRIVTDMIAALRRCQGQYHWDLADDALDTYGHMVDKLDFIKSSSGSAMADIEPIPCLSLPGMEGFSINIEDFIQWEPEDYLQDFEFSLDNETSLIAPI